MNITLFAKSSSGGSYSVDFKEVNGLLTVWCDCPAGEWGKFCKHKWQLLNGNEKMLADLNQVKELKTINALAIKRNLGDSYKEVESLEKLKKSLTKDQKKEKDSVKKSLSKRKLLTEEEFMGVNKSLHDMDRKISFTSYLISKEKEVVENKLKNGF